MPYPVFDRSKLIVKPLTERKHDMHMSEMLPLDADVPVDPNPDYDVLARRLVEAKERGSARMLMMGAHVIKVGMSRWIIDMMERGLITHLSANGACAIHDYELSLVGETTESVARYIKSGEFGLWRETGNLNEIAKCAASEGIGFGEAVGREILEGDYPHKDVSIFAAAKRLGIPATIHVGIGYDIIHEHPNTDGAALGAASYTDFLIFTETIYRGLEGGVYLCFGSAVMGPEVYLKALSMARNVAQQEGRIIRNFATAVFDLIQIGSDYHTEAPKDDPRYYYRPFKTILVRTVAEGGESFYIRGDHRVTMPNLVRRATAGIRG
jgi:hypothetical protein